ncbi:MAG: NusG domain II-containing protein [Nitrospirae bacterium]|nr:NusG domain II-containing protein [Nitrospirota bacterium]
MKTLNILKETTLLDWVLFVFLLIMSISGFFFARILSANQSDLVTVEVKGKMVYRLSLLQDTTVNVKGPLGTTVIEIKDGRVRVKDSPCPEKICVKQGWTKHGAIVCVPNKVVVIIGTDNNRTLDAITG